MAEYDGRYGGLTMDNKTEFWPRWKAAQRHAAAASEGSCHTKLVAKVPAEGLELAFL